MDIPREMAADDRSVSVVILKGTPVAQGTPVCGTDGEHIGRLKACDMTQMLVDRAWHRDVFVPLSAVKAVTAARIVLTIPAAQVNEMDWPHPPLL